jgi:putative hydrolase of the HAD superfamily
MSTPAFLYFDMGKVLLSFCNDGRGRQMAAAAGVTPELLKQALEHAEGGHSALWRFERGDFDLSAMYEHICQHTGSRPDMAALYAAGCDMFGAMAESVALVERLADAGHRLGILSNTNPADWEYVRREFPFLGRYFEQTALSFEAKSMKPDAGIFEYAVRRAGVPAEQVFFTDDMPANVAGARAAGLDAVQFTTAGALELELRARGVRGL